MSARDAAELRNWYRDISGSQIVATDTGDTTLATGKASHKIFIQRIIAYITTDAAQSWTFQDSADTPQVVAKVTTSPGVDTRWDFDFGEVGMPLTEGKNFVLNVSAAGLAGHIEWYGYLKQSSTVSMDTLAAL